jgi:nucleotide-binding universal stress UspA family protein
LLDQELVDSIIHATDCSDLSQSGFEHALALAVRLESTLAIVHVEPAADETDWHQFPGVRDKLIEWGKLPPESERSAVHDQLGVTVKKINLLQQEPVQATIRYLKRHKNSLAVLSTGGRTGIDRWLQPSISEAIMREGTTKTLVVPEGATGFVDRATGDCKISRILVPVSSHPSADPALYLAVNIAEQICQDDVEIKLMHIGQKTRFPRFESDLSRISMEHQVSPGNVVQKLANESSMFDLLVMATEGRVNLFDMVTGSTTERIIRESHCPVLSVPSE